MKKEELEILIPSGYVRNYVKETGWTFTDREKASLLYHADIPWRERCQSLKDLRNQTHDGELKRQIYAYLDKIQMEYAAFQENGDRSHIYILKIREDGGSWDGEYLARGYFFDWKTAYRCGKQEDVPFGIEKYLVNDMTVSEDDPCSCYPVAWLWFNRDGEAVCLWDSKEMSGYDNKCFDVAIIEIPNPFERGDIVKYKRSDGQEFSGIIEGEREEWESRLAWHLERVKEGDPSPDFSDLFISVAFLCEDGTFAFSDSINPLDLERYEPKEADWENGSVDTLLLCARNIYCCKGYLSTLFEVLAKYRRSKGK